MKKAKKIIGALGLMLVVTSCSTSLEKDLSSCNCDDIWDMVEDKELLEIIEVWGQPEDRGGSALNKKFYATWHKKLNTNCSGDDDCGKIKVNWKGYLSASASVAPLGTPTSIHCEGSLIHD